MSDASPMPIPNYGYVMPSAATVSQLPTKTTSFTHVYSLYPTYMRNPVDNSVQQSPYYTPINSPSSTGIASVGPSSDISSCSSNVTSKSSKDVEFLSYVHSNGKNQHEVANTCQKPLLYRPYIDDFPNECLPGSSKGAYVQQEQHAVRSKRAQPRYMPYLGSRSEEERSHTPQPQLKQAQNQRVQCTQEQELSSASVTHEPHLHMHQQNVQVQQVQQHDNVTKVSAIKEQKEHIQLPQQQQQQQHISYPFFYLGSGFSGTVVKNSDITANWTKDPPLQQCFQLQVQQNVPIMHKQSTEVQHEQVTQQQHSLEEIQSPVLETPMRDEHMNATWTKNPSQEQPMQVQQHVQTQKQPLISHSILHLIGDSVEIAAKDCGTTASITDELPKQEHVKVQVDEHANLYFESGLVVTKSKDENNTAFLSKELSQQEHIQLQSASKDNEIAASCSKELPLCKHVQVSQEQQPISHGSLYFGNGSMKTTFNQQQHVVVQAQHVKVQQDQQQHVQLQREQHIPEQNLHESLSRDTPHVSHKSFSFGNNSMGSTVTQQQQHIQVQEQLARMQQQNFYHPSSMNYGIGPKKPTPYLDKLKYFALEYKQRLLAKKLQYPKYKEDKLKRYKRKDKKYIFVPCNNKNSEENIQEPETNAQEQRQHDHEQEKQQQGNVIQSASTSTLPTLQHQYMQQQYFQRQQLWQQQQMQQLYYPQQQQQQGLPAVYPVYYPLPASVNMLMPNQKLIELSHENYHKTYPQDYERQLITRAEIKPQEIFQPIPTELCGNEPTELIVPKEIPNTATSIKSQSTVKATELEEIFVKHCNTGTLTEIQYEKLSNEMAISIPILESWFENRIKLEAACRGESHVSSTNETHTTQTKSSPNHDKRYPLKPIPIKALPSVNMLDVQIFRPKY